MSKKHQCNLGIIGTMNNNTTMQWLSLSGKTYVVTGAGSGIGASIAEQLLQAGASTALLDINVEQCDVLRMKYQNDSVRVTVHSCNISEEESIGSALMEVGKAHVNLAGLVNCAGIMKPASVAETSLADWNTVLGTNLTGCMMMSRGFMALVGQKPVSLVHIASVAARSPQTYSGAYSASKAGVLLLSRQIAAEMGQFGIRSNVICPGMICTALSAPFYADESIKARRESLTANKTIGTADDIAHAALFLLSDRAAYINGAELVVDGGLEVMLMDKIPRPGFKK